MSDNELDALMKAGIATSVESAKRLMKEAELRVLDARTAADVGIAVVVLVRAATELVRLRTKEVE